MKKLILFLLFANLTQAQSGQEQEFDYGIKITGGQTLDTTATRVNVQNASGVINYNSIANFQKEKGYLSTGLLRNGLITINGDPTKYSVTAGIGVITNFSNPDNVTSTIVRFAGTTGKTPAYLTTANITYVAINASGVIVESALPFTPQQNRSLIILGAVIHSNRTTVEVINNISSPSNDSKNQLNDFMNAVGALNIVGNKFTANGANLILNKTAGTLFKNGSNFANDITNPHQIDQTQTTALTFRYRTQNGTEGTDRIALNPTLYDLNNVLTSVPNNNFSIQTVSLFQQGAVRIQYDQATYNTLDEAEKAINTRAFNVESNIALQGVTRAYIIMRNSATSLQTVADAKIIEAQKFGGVTSGGTAVTLAQILAALTYTPENLANKQNSLTVDGTGVKYPTVDAVNNGLALKENNGIALRGSETLISGNILRSSGGLGVSNSVIFESSGRIGIGSPSFGETLGLYNFTDVTSQFKIRNNNSILSIEQVPDHNRILSLNSDSSGSKDFVLGGHNATSFITMKANGNVLIANNPDNGSRFQVNGKIYSNKSIQTSDDTDAASSSNAGSIRYRVSGNNSYIDMVMQTALSTYEWVNIIQNNW